MKNKEYYQKLSNKKDRVKKNNAIAYYASDHGRSKLRTDNAKTVLKEVGITYPTAHAILLSILQSTREGEFSTASHNKLAARAGFSRGTVIKAFKVLRRLGLIFQKDRYRMSDGLPRRTTGLIVIKTAFLSDFNALRTALSSMSSRNALLFNGIYRIKEKLRYFNLKTGEMVGELDRNTNYGKITY